MVFSWVQFLFKKPRCENNSMTYLIIKTTCADEKEAQKLAKILLKEKLVACVQISKIKSFYHWQGDLNCDSEYEISLKTKQQNYQKIADIIVQNHDYELPQIIAIPIVQGYKKYLEWLDDSLV
jgi:periplasmic divalent cation tolerance protein